MSFYIIKNNDLASADVVMSNFTHINYGSALLPVNYNGNTTNLSLDLGSPGGQWNNLYVGNIILTDNLKYYNGKEGDLRYSNAQGIEQAIPIGTAGHFLQSNGTHPVWGETPTANVVFHHQSSLFFICKAQPIYRIPIPTGIKDETRLVFSYFLELGKYNLTVRYPVHASRYMETGRLNGVAAYVERGYITFRKKNYTTYIGRYIFRNGYNAEGKPYYKNTEIIGTHSANAQLLIWEIL